MRSLLHVVGNQSPAGQQLPEILPTLTADGVIFRRAQLHMIAAQPGGGKTMLALWYAVQSGIPTLYFSADSDARTMTIRTAAILMGKTVREIENLLASDAAPMVHQALEDGASHIRFDFDPGPSLQDIEDEIKAYVEIYADTPHMIILDNLLNVAGSNDNEWTAMRDAMSAFHYMARETESAFVVLHHVSENDSKPNVPAPRKALQGKVSQLPELVLSVALDGTREQYKIAVVKNRHGQADPTADQFTTVSVDPPRMTLYNSITDKNKADHMREIRG